MSQYRDNTAGQQKFRATFGAYSHHLLVCNVSPIDSPGLRPFAGVDGGGAFGIPHPGGWVGVVGQMETPPQGVGKWVMAPLPPSPLSYLPSIWCEMADTEAFEAVV
jgi:hypothetical protein